MSGRGRGRGRRVGGQTLAGTVADPLTSSTAAAASPSPAPERSTSSRASSSAAAAAATEDAPNDATTTTGTGTGSGTKPVPSRGPTTTRSLRRLPSVGVGSTRAPSVGLAAARTPSIGPPGSGSLRDRPVGGLLGSTSEFRPSAAAAAGGTAGSGKAKFKPNMKRRDKLVEHSDDE